MVAMSIDTAPDAAVRVVPETAAATAPDAAPETVVGTTPDAAPDTVPDGGTDLASGRTTGGWMVEQRGSFLIGRCDACGHTTAARRARYSMETDMQRHDAECGDSQEAGADGL